MLAKIVKHSEKMDLSYLALGPQKVNLCLKLIFQQARLKRGLYAGYPKNTYPYPKHSPGFLD